MPIYRSFPYRSYLHGSVGPFQTLLGHSELKRTLPDGRLRVFIGTWNMNGKVIVQLAFIFQTWQYQGSFLSEPLLIN